LLPPLPQTDDEDEDLNTGYRKKQDSQREKDDEEPEDNSEEVQRRLYRGSEIPCETNERRGSNNQIGKVVDNAIRRNTPDSTSFSSSCR
jgi:hypothetical protein